MTLAEVLNHPNLAHAAGAAGGAFGAALGQLMLNARIRKRINQVVRPLEARLLMLESKSHEDLLTRLERLEKKIP